LNKLVASGPATDAAAGGNACVGTDFGVDVGRTFGLGFGEEQQAHLSVVSGLDTKHVSQVHFGVAGLANMPNRSMRILINLLRLKNKFNLNNITCRWK